MGTLKFTVEMIENSMNMVCVFFMMVKAAIQ